MAARTTLFAVWICFGLAAPALAQATEASDEGAPAPADAPLTEFDKLVNRSDGMFVDRGDGAFRLSDDAQFIQSRPPSDSGLAPRGERAGQSPEAGARRDYSDVFAPSRDER